ncbi:transposase [Neokomagataea tanensis]|uniref:transposase n=1 Tax=Neokomagataea TaxID=1223423 RepID=UPI001F1162C5|nr:transposase [Neokomagataea tanensis]
MSRFSSSWRVDETYIKIRGKWAYCYWADGEDDDTNLSSHSHRTLRLSNTFGQSPERRKTERNPGRSRILGYSGLEKGTS